MNFNFESSSFWVVALVLMAITTIPVKLAANFVGAERTSIPMCALSVVVGSILAFGAYKLVGGQFTGFISACLAMVITYKFVLHASFAASFLLALVAFGLQVAILLSLPGMGKFLV
ncbi:MAG: hypothetical protein HY080_15200 [Gammaproteobacteria bacterium]|nr:hypothetical protein [Gammaproteobacteria bacterium]